MPETESGFVVRFGYADADHVSLTGVHNALDAVQELVDLSLDDRFEVGLHVLSRYLDCIGGGDPVADGDIIQIGTDKFYLVILYCGCIHRVDQLEAVHS